MSTHKPVAQEMARVSSDFPVSLRAVLPRRSSGRPFSRLSLRSVIFSLYRSKGRRFGYQSHHGDTFISLWSDAVEQDERRQEQGQEQQKPSLLEERYLRFEVIDEADVVQIQVVDARRDEVLRKIPTDALVDLLAHVRLQQDEKENERMDEQLERHVQDLWGRRRVSLRA